MKNHSVVCELGWEDADPRNSNYSMREIDVYAWIPYHFKERNHRLSLRKNLKDEVFEAIEVYHGIVMGDPRPSSKVVKSSSELETVLEFIDEQWIKFHNKGKVRRELDGTIKTEARNHVCCNHGEDEFDRRVDEWDCPSIKKKG